ncbi:MAG TPA: ABC transporter ATP-binding protein [Ignavibacteria bacterium]|nr:ABC transporter ATP-binding protein [Ignavibacteria bacterium]
MNQIFRLNELSFTYSDKNGIKQTENDFELKDISFNIDCGDFVSVIGKNGSGKSTLVKLISKILNGYSGNIFFKGNEIRSIERKEFSRNVSYLPQTASAFNEELKVSEFLLLGRYAHKQFTDFRFSQDDLRIVTESMSETSVTDLSGKFIHKLSGGEKQKVLITLALVQLDITDSLEGKVLIIDEPMTYLDVNYQFEIFSILKRLREKKLTVIIVIHDLNLALRFSNRTILMNKGKLIKYDLTGEVITEEILKEHFLIDSKILNFEKNFFINYLPN